EASMSRVACVRIWGDTASGLPPGSPWCHTACAGDGVKAPAPGGFRRSPDRAARPCTGGPPFGEHGECAFGRPRRDACRPTLHGVSFPWHGNPRYRPGRPSRSPASMRCPSCAYEKLADSRFCAQCGVPLGRDPARVPDPRAYTPRHLAEKILSHRSALHGERKQVTVLFADVKGSMDLAEQVDPETWHRILDRFFGILAEGVHRFEGTVNQFTGDGIMALFGAPIAHEDHAQRACWAALHLRDEVRRYADELRTARGFNFAVRMGLNSGEVVVGRIGDDLRMDYTALGHTVGLAQRMEQLAEPGKPLLTERTAKLVTGFFSVRDLGPSRVKGMTEPIRLYELEGAGRLRTRFDVSRARGLSRFVGRAPEMAALEASLEHALAGEGQIVGVVGEPGVGKSRLCHEFAERCRARGIPFIEAHAVAHGKTIPLLPWMELMRNAFGVTEQDGDDMARQKI